MTNPVSRMPNSAKKSRKLAAIYGVRRATTPQTSEVPRVATCSPFDGRGSLRSLDMVCRLAFVIVSVGTIAAVVYLGRNGTIQRFRVKHRLLGSEAGRDRLLLLGRKSVSDAKTVQVSHRTCGKEFCPAIL